MWAMTNLSTFQSQPVTPESLKFPLLAEQLKGYNCVNVTCKTKRLHPLYVYLLRMLNPNQDHNGVSDIDRIFKVLNLKAVTHSHNHQRAEEEELSCLPRGKLIE